MIFKKPLFWDYKKPNLLSYFLLPLTLPIIIRNFFFTTLKKKKFPEIKTICVGNIYLGGTGKTPLCIKIYEILKEKNFNIATVKKFYKNQKDEQLLLQKKTITIIADTRKEAVLESIKKKYAVLIFDDGLQDSQIDYDKKLVCFKSNNWIGNGRIIPAGPLREKISSLKRFDAIFLNGNKDNNKELKEKILRINSNIKIFQTSYKISDINKYDLNSEYLIFSGIGEPKDFKNLLIENGFKIKKEIIFSDHFEYTSKEINKILDLAKNENLKILTTEKDYMKLSQSLNKEISFLDIDLEIENQKELINFLLN
jgi:tetraacyldisaccharide 4'-kinase|tara:strand:- start:2641 stop:3573 length:933 start_codon:yes stop_codon:yes gene_type:complete